MTTTTPHGLALALAAGATLLTVTGCGSGGQGGTTPEPTVTVTATETTVPTSAASSPAAVPATSNPRVTRPAQGTCTTSALRVRYADDRGGAGAGSVSGTLTFTNTGSGPCTLEGFPGVSYVTGDSGTQVGAAATRADGSPSTTTLKAGGSATAALRRSQPGGYGDACGTTKVRGFRVYPPGSTAAVFVPFPTTGCTSTSAPLLQVGPVR